MHGKEKNVYICLNKTKQQYIMKTISHISGTNNLLVNGQVVEFTNYKEKNKAAAKLEKDGYSYNTGYADTDEFAGLCQASQLGMKTFEATILG